MSVQCLGVTNSRQTTKSAFAYPINLYAFCLNSIHGDVILVLIHVYQVPSNGIDLRKIEECFVMPIVSIVLVRYINYARR